MAEGYMWGKLLDEGCMQLAGKLEQLIYETFDLL